MVNQELSAACLLSTVNRLILSFQLHQIDGRHKRLPCTLLVIVLTALPALNFALKF